MCVSTKSDSFCLLRLNISRKILHSLASHTCVSQIPKAKGADNVPSALH